MQGHFEVGAYHTPGLTEEKLNVLLGPKELRKSGSVLRLLNRYEKTQEARGHNLVFDNMAGSFFRHLMHGAGITTPFTNSAGSSLGILSLTTHADEPTYQEIRQGNAYQGMNSVNGNVGAGTSKRFSTDEVEPYLISEDATGKEAITYRGRFLWLPAEAVSSIIRSIGAWHRDNADVTSSTYTDIITRIRLKDSAGNPIVINKTSNITLFVEYRFTLISV